MKRDQVTSLATMITLGAVLLFFWDAPAVWPLKILVVWFHELGHAVAALATGGSVVAIGLSPDQGGVTHVLGGISLITLNAGYLGSLLAGALLLRAARTPRGARRAVRVLAALLGATTLLWVRPMLGFAFLFALLTTFAVFALGRWANDFVTRLFLRTVGVFSVLYALWDIRSDVFSAGPHAITDATMLAELTWIPAPVWGFAWLLAGVALLWGMRRSIL